MLTKTETTASLQISALIARIVASVTLAAIGGGCAHSQFRSDSEFNAAVLASKEVVDRLNQMPVDDLAKLAFSKKLQKKWSDREDEVFAGTRYIGASVEHDFPMGSTTRHRWGPDQRLLLSVGRGRPAFDGYLGTGGARIPEYTGPTYVYRVFQNKGWTELTVYIAAPERAKLDE